MERHRYTQRNIGHAATAGNENYVQFVSRSGIKCLAQEEDDDEYTKEATNKHGEWPVIETVPLFKLAQSR